MAWKEGPVDRTGEDIYSTFHLPRELVNQSGLDKHTAKSLYMCDIDYAEYDFIDDRPTLLFLKDIQRVYTQCSEEQYYHNFKEKMRKHSTQIYIEIATVCDVGFYHIQLYAPDDETPEEFYVADGRQDYGGAIYTPAEYAEWLIHIRANWMAHKLGRSIIQF